MKILVATDGSSGAENAIRFASRLASELHSTLTLLHVIPKISTTKEDIIILLEEEMGSKVKAGTKYLEAGKRIAGEFNITAETKLLEGDPADKILKEADNYDLLVVSSHGKGTVDRFLLGSVSLELVHKSKTPVTVVR